MGKITVCPWETISKFKSLAEFNRFLSWMREQVILDEAADVPVIAPYVGAFSLKEKWFKHTASGETWRLVWPDGPFTGLFEQVS